MFFAFWNLQAQQKPENFISHKVKKRETIFGITRSYNITEEQLIEYNPLLDKVGLRKRMLLRIPVYNQQIKEVVVPELTIEDKSTQKYIVKSKETKWRIAYNFKITIKYIMEIVSISLCPENTDAQKTKKSPTESISLHQ